VGASFLALQPRICGSQHGDLQPVRGRSCALAPADLLAQRCSLGGRMVAQQRRGITDELWCRPFERRVKEHCGGPKAVRAQVGSVRRPWHAR